MVARTIGPARVQCPSCGKRVAARSSADEPRLHNCPHGWACPPIDEGARACPVCAEARQLGLWGPKVAT